VIRGAGHEDGITPASQRHAGDSRPGLRGEHKVGEGQEDILKCHFGTSR